jgi:hypothetical protein
LAGFYSETADGLKRVFSTNMSFLRELRHAKEKEEGFEGWYKNAQAKQSEAILVLAVRH